MTRICVQCSGAFEPVQHTQKTCSHECQRAFRNKRSRAWHYANYVPKVHEKTCIVCGGSYHTKYAWRKICEAEDCRKQMSSERGRKYRADNKEYLQEKGMRYREATREHKRAYDKRPDVMARNRARQAEYRAIIKAFRELQLSVQGK